MSNKVTLSLRVEQHVKSNLSEISKNQDRSVSYVCNRVLRDYCIKALSKKDREPKSVNTEPTDQIEIPAFIDLDLWDEFLRIRKKAKAVNSPRAIKMLVNKLTRFAEKGHNVNELIKTSYINGWKDIYEPNQKANFNTKSSTIERFHGESEEWIKANLQGADDKFGDAIQGDRSKMSKDDGYPMAATRGDSWGEIY